MGTSLEVANLSSATGALRLQNDTRVIRCRQHGLKAPVDRELNDPEADILRIAQCLIPSARMAKFFLDNVLKETWPKLAQEFVGLTLSTWNLQVWQSPVMQASFAAVMDMFQIVPGQVGFLAKAGREEQRPNRQPTTAEERWTAGAVCFTMEAHEKSQRSAKRQKTALMRPPNFFKVTTEACRNKSFFTFTYFALL